VRPSQWIWLFSPKVAGHGQGGLDKFPPYFPVSPGNTVKLSCALSSGTSIVDYYVSWYQQKSGNSPRYLLYYYTDSSKGQGSGVPARFSGSKDTASNAGYLTISGVLAEDEADYYCAVIKSGTGVPHSDTDRWGSETKTSFSLLPRPGPYVQSSPVSQFLSAQFNSFSDLPQGLQQTQWSQALRFLMQKHI
uniref:Ig-like domain-containing protein n=1 Tax=Chrysemys picta bellii TaxID=8478 RepID=A0A8C3F5N2_CHRPI